MREGFLKGGFHLFSGRFRSNLRRHVIQVFPKVFGVAAVLAFKGPRNNMGEVSVGRHTSGARLSLKRRGILLR